MSISSFPRFPTLAFRPSFSTFFLSSNEECGLILITAWSTEYTYCRRILLASCTVSIRRLFLSSLLFFFWFSFFFFFSLTRKFFQLQVHAFRLQTVHKFICWGRVEYLYFKSNQQASTSWKWSKYHCYLVFFFWVTMVSTIPPFSPFISYIQFLDLVIQFLWHSHSPSKFVRYLLFVFLFILSISFRSSRRVEWDAIGNKCIY